MDAAKNRKKIRVKDLAMTAMGVALIVLCSWISVPLTVPFTMQTFAVCLLAALLGARRGLWTVGVYVLLAAVGVPVLSGFKGGVGALLGVTGGYIIGFFFTAITVGLSAELWGRRLRVLIPAMAVGILLCYVFGTAWFIFVYAKSSGPIGIGAALGWCVLPYLPADALKIVLASLLAVRLYPTLERDLSW